MNTFNKLMNAIKVFLQIFLSDYKPEKHYMRGPGPACAAKNKK